LRRRWLDHLLPWLLLAALATPVAAVVWRLFQDNRGTDELTWRHPWTLLLLPGCALIAWLGFHVRTRRAGAFAHSQVAALAAMPRGPMAYLSSLPSVLRIVAVALIAVALTRPQTYRTTQREVDSVDIMIVLDISKSMEEVDLPRNRLDAGQRTIRDFLRRRDSDDAEDKREQDRIGMVVFAQQAMVQCPLTLDYRSLDQIVANTAIGDVPEMGTDIGDALALAVGTLVRSKADDPEHPPSKVVILMSDGDANMHTQFDPEAARELAVKSGIKVFTMLLGEEQAPGGMPFGAHAVNPELLKGIAAATGGMFFRASDQESLDSSFRRVRDTLQKGRRVEKGKTLAHELYPIFLVPALLLLLLEAALRFTRLRRFP
jgi:Ca-activated chloride channel family protein